MKRVVLLALLVPGIALAADAITPARLKRDLEQGARLFRQGPENASAHAYAARLSWVDVEWEGTTITVRDPDRKWYGKEACTREEVEAFERDVGLAGDPTRNRRERGTAA